MNRFLILKDCDHATEAYQVSLDDRQHVIGPFLCPTIRKALCRGDFINACQNRGDYFVLLFFKNDRQYKRQLLLAPMRSSHAVYCFIFIFALLATETSTAECPDNEQECVGTAFQDLAHSVNSDFNSNPAISCMLNR